MVSFSLIIEPYWLIACSVFFLHIVIKCLPCAVYFSTVCAISGWSFKLIAFSVWKLWPGKKSVKISRRQKFKCSVTKGKFLSNFTTSDQAFQNPPQKIHFYCHCNQSKSCEQFIKELPRNIPAMFGRKIGTVVKEQNVFTKTVDAACRSHLDPKSSPLSMLCSGKLKTVLRTL